MEKGDLKTSVDGDYFQFIFCYYLIRKQKTKKTKNKTKTIVDTS